MRKFPIFIAFKRCTFELWTIIIINNRLKHFHFSAIILFDVIVKWIHETFNIFHRFSSLMPFFCSIGSRLLFCRSSSFPPILSQPFPRFSFPTRFSFRNKLFTNTSMRIAFFSLRRELNMNESKSIKLRSLFVAIVSCLYMLWIGCVFLLSSFSSKMSAEWKSQWKQANKDARRHATPQRNGGAFKCAEIAKSTQFRKETRWKSYTACMKTLCNVGIWKRLLFGKCQGMQQQRRKRQ